MTTSATKTRRRRQAQSRSERAAEIRTPAIAANVARTRETFRISREMKFFSESELRKQIGYPRDLWLLAITKELVDNSRDHCEETGALPKVTIKLTANGLTVSDNGIGISPDTVAGMLDFGQLISSREVFR